MENREYYHIRQEVAAICDSINQFENAENMCYDFVQTDDSLEQQLDNSLNMCCHSETSIQGPDIDDLSASENTSNITTISDQLDDFQTLNLSNDIAEWFVDFKITEEAGNGLLKVLRKYHPNLPKNIRTIKKTPNESNSLIVPIGLKKSVEKFLRNVKYNKDVIQVDVGVDGVPLTKSSTNQLWPILGNIVPFSEVFIIGIFHGYKKPYCANSFLRAFMDVLRDLNEHYIMFENRKIQIQIRLFICDAPARAFILGNYYINYFFILFKLKFNFLWIFN